MEREAEEEQTWHKRGEVRKERCEGLKYLKELALDRREEAINSCVETLIFGSSSFIIFLC
jgi:hypothetical protein